MKDTLSAKQALLSKSQNALKEAQQVQENALKSKQAAENKLTNAQKHLQELKISYLTAGKQKMVKLIIM